MYGVHRRLGVVRARPARRPRRAGHRARRWRLGRRRTRLFLPTAGWAVFAGSVALACMAAALALTFFARLSHERFVLVQRALGVTFAIAALHALGVPGPRSSTPLLVFLAVLTALALSAFVCRSFLARFLARRHRYAVARMNRLDESVVEISLEPLGRAISFIPGQFIFVSFRGRGRPRAAPLHDRVVAHASGRSTSSSRRWATTPTALTGPPGRRARRRRRRLRGRSPISTSRTCGRSGSQVGSGSRRF